MNWELAEQRLNELNKHYQKKRYRYSIVMALIVDPLVKRFESGERTSELYEDISHVYGR